MPVSTNGMIGAAGAGAPAGAAISPSSNGGAVDAVESAGGAAGGAAASSFQNNSFQQPSHNVAETTSPVGADFYQAAVLNAGIPVVSLDATGRILAWNQAAVRLFGRSEAEVLGLPLETLIPSEYRSAASRAFQRTIQQRSVNVYEISLVPQGGKHPVHVGVTLSCVNDNSAAPGGGGLKGVIAWMRDITNRKELESHLTRTRHMASVGTLAAGVAHHFNNIACGMGTMVEFALATEDSGAMLKALRMSAEACSRISYITQSLLACSGEAGSDCGCSSDLCDLTEELLRFADAVEPTLNEKGIALELDFQARRITAIPRLRFGQALQHLLHNAEDAIADRSSKMPDAERRISIRTQSQGDQIMIQFGDTGIGIDPDDLPQIFDPFFTKKGVQGGGNRNNPGLGLTLVHSVVMDMGGHIWADSTPNKGTNIYILIPIVV
ncbi:MAG TPA: ATP-binding protein [Phycisphaerae bacterium]|nr:ATP-binding protein [Phycisphaerae bacterium]